MRKLESLVGQTFGRLTVLSEAARTTYGTRRWNCSCSCGNTTVSHQGTLVSGRGKSCGCLHKSIVSANSYKHGGIQSPEYGVWKAMIQRCTNPKDKKWHNYGGRGIAVCSRWFKYANFIADMGPRPSDYSLDRINNNRNYEPGNCRWADIFTQNNNTRKRVEVSYKGKTQSVAQWAREVGIDPGTIGSRMRRGWSAEKALTTPVRKLSNRQ